MRMLELITTWTPPAYRHATAYGRGPDTGPAVPQGSGGEGGIERQGGPRQAYALVLGVPSDDPVGACGLVQVEAHPAEAVPCVGQTAGEPLPLPLFVCGGGVCKGRGATDRGPGGSTCSPPITSTCACVSCFTAWCSAPAGLALAHLVVDHHKGIGSGHQRLPAARAR